jgi:hypothetical protein
VASTAVDLPAADDSAIAADDDVGGAAQVASAVQAPVDAGMEPMMETGTSASIVEQAGQATPMVAVQARGATWSERLDRWFFSDLASLWTRAS